MKSTNNINGIPLHYARLTEYQYGTRGQQRDFILDESFLEILEIAFKEVFDNCPLGIPEAITTAGTFVDNPGQHGHGKAFDLDAIFWPEESLVTLNFIHQKELYLGIESFLRRHFGIVLNYFYPQHRDHWHFDVSVPVDFNKDAKSEIFYVQMALKYIYGEEILIDGLWGRQTNSIVKKVFEKLRIPTPITTKVNYLKFLELTGKIAFELSEKKNSPVQLLDNLKDVLDDLPTPLKNKVKEALNSFINHEQTAIWLIEFDEQDDADIDAIIESMVA